MQREKALEESPHANTTTEALLYHTVQRRETSHQMQTLSLCGRHTVATCCVRLPGLPGLSSLVRTAQLANQGLYMHKNKSAKQLPI
jgi:hypothetical protein